MAPTGSVTLDRAEQAFADCLAGYRAGQWAAGDVAWLTLTEAPDRKARAAVIGRLAQVGHCTSNYVRQLARMAEAFPPPTRKDDVSWSLYRACLRRAGRSGNPLVILEKALAGGGHVSDVERLQGETAVTFRGRCGDCGAKVSVRTVGMKGHPVRCPVCSCRDSTPPELGWLR